MLLYGTFRYLKRGIDKIIHDFNDMSSEGLKSKELNRLNKIKHEEWIKENNYVLCVGTNYYTEQDILDGKCRLNGTLVNMGYLSNLDGTWRKK